MSIVQLHRECSQLLLIASQPLANTLYLKNDQVVRIRVPLMNKNVGKNFGASTRTKKLQTLLVRVVTIVFAVNS